MKKSNEKMESTYLVRQKQLKQSAKQKDFLKLELINSAGTRCFGILWKNPKNTYEQIKFGQAIKVKSHPIKPNQDRLFEIDYLEILDNFKIDEFYQKEQISSIDLNWLETILSDQSNNYRSILTNVFTPFVKQQLLSLPAGKLWVFNEFGGLLKRTRTLIDWVEKIHLANMDLELLKTAVLLQSFAFINGFIQDSVLEYTGEARLISLPVLALISVNSSINASTIDSLKKDHLKHLILIQPQITNGNGSVEPQSLEAVLLYDLQILMMNLYGVENLINKSENKNRTWTNYNQLLKRYILVDKTKLNKS